MSPCRDGTAVLRGHLSHAKASPFAGQRKYVLSSFLSYFKTLSIGPAPEIEPMTSQSAVKRSNN